MSSSEASQVRLGAGHDWSSAVDDILDGDLAVMLADITPAKGVVLSPITNFGLHERSEGAITVLSSLGTWRKLNRIRRNPKVTLAFHTRRHGFASGREYVLVQGTASFSTTPDRAWLESIEPNWTRFMGPRDRGLWEKWMHAYQWERIGVRIIVERVVTWPDLRCQGEMEVHGTPLPANVPAPQPPPGKGTEPRVDVARLVQRVSQLPDTLLGWVGTDGFPVVVPVNHAHATRRGVVLDLPSGLIPPGGRRAGLTAHWFTAGVLGQEQRLYTGWLEADPETGEVVYSPHTEAGYRMPPSKLVYRIAVGTVTRLGLRKARRAGFLADSQA